MNIGPFALAFTTSHVEEKWVERRGVVREIARKLIIEEQLTSGDEAAAVSYCQVARASKRVCSGAAMFHAGTA